MIVCGKEKISRRNFFSEWMESEEVLQAEGDFSLLVFFFFSLTMGKAG